MVGQYRKASPGEPPRYKTISLCVLCALLRLRSELAEWGGVCGSISSFNDDFDLLDNVVPRFWEGAGHRLGYAVGVDCPAAKIVFSRFCDSQQGRPVDDCVGDRPAERFVGFIELEGN